MYHVHTFCHIQFNCILELSSRVGIPTNSTDTHIEVSECGFSRHPADSRNSKSLHNYWLASSFCSVAIRADDCSFENLQQNVAGSLHAERERLGRGGGEKY